MEKSRPITTEMLLPAEDQSAKTKWQMTHLLREVLGQGSLRFCRIIQEGGYLSEDIADGMDKYVFGSVKRRYKLPDPYDPQGFYLQQQMQAIRVVERISERLPEIAKDIELKDEISMLSDRPSDLMRLMFRTSDDIDSTLAYEVQRHVILSAVAGEINARTKNGRLRSVLSEVHRLLDERLFEGSLGAGKRFFLESFHDDDTNTVVGFPDLNQQAPRTAHLKRTPFIARSIKGAGLVITSPRKKDDSVAIEKSLIKAKNNGGLININGDVLDPIGMMFVAMDGYVTPEQLAEQVVLIIESGSRKITKIENNDEIEADHGQSSEYRHTRRRIWFEDISVPVEMIFHSRENYLNSTLEVGTRNPVTGLHQGRAHPLFELRREEQVARILFPSKVYPVDIETAFINRDRRIIRELREMNKVA